LLVAAPSVTVVEVFPVVVWPSYTDLLFSLIMIDVCSLFGDDQGSLKLQIQGCFMLRAMMYDQNLPLSLWAEAASTAVYIQNRCPHKALEAKTLEEVFTGIKPLVDHLRIFGSPVYIHIPKEKRTKLEPSGKKGTFVGYSETSKAYRIYIPGQKFIEVSRDVTFREEAVFRRARELPCDLEEQEALPLDSSR
jgi:hypothetical protein